MIRGVDTPYICDAEMICTVLFTSSVFLLFLATLLAVYSLAPQKHRWFVLLVGSMAFYAYAGPIFLIYICTTIIVTYFCTMRIRRLWLLRDEFAAATDDKEQRKQNKAKTKALTRRWLVAALLINLGILAMVKYTDFAIGNVNAFMALFGADRSFGFMRFALPMGISFYTFQTVAYLVDVYRERTKPERNPLKFALFVSFFPQIIQGPISRFSELSQTLYSGTPVTGTNLSRGGQRVLWGFFKKLVVADRLFPALLVLTGTPEEFTGAFYLLSIALYAIILFCDFTGGIDITIGIAEMFGIRLPENFNRPFYSRSIQEYWQRWHMTMYAWFRDYVFYPMSVGKNMLKFSKFTRRVFGDGLGKRLPVHVSLIWVWFLTGLWHGATWNFIAWGLANGFVIMFSLEAAPLYARFHGRFPKAAESYIFRAGQIFRTFWLMNMIRSFDIYDGVGNTFRMMGSIVTDFGLADFLTRGVSELTLPVADYVSAAIGLLAIFWVSYMGRGDVDFRDRLRTNFSWPARYAVFGLILIAVLIFGAYGHGYDARQFIYNQF